MRPLTKSLVLFAVVAFYSLLYVATSREECSEDCEKRVQLQDLLRNNRDYIFYVDRCGVTYGTDTLCIGVVDTAGVNWDLLADTACTYANSVGLLRQTIFFLDLQVSPYDTLARKQCP